MGAILKLKCKWSKGERGKFRGTKDGKSHRKFRNIREKHQRGKK